MAKEVKLPQLGQTMEEGTVVSCLVKIDDEVKKGDILFEIETDKATLEMESPADGFVKQIVAEAGQTLPVGELLMILGDKDEQVAAVATAGKPAQTAAPAEQKAPQSAAEKPSAKPAAAPVEAPASANVIRLPQLGQTMEEGTIVTCLVKENDEIKKGDVIFEIETDKATLEMESPAGGFVKSIIAEVGQTVPVGDAVMVLADKDEGIPQGFIDSLTSGAAVEAPAETAQPAAAAQAAPAAKAAVGGKVIASPRAKKLAKELGVDIAIVTGTGPAGRIIEKDVQAAAAKKVAAAPAPTEIKLGTMFPVNRLQKITAQKMLQSKQTIPCFYLTVQADVTDMVEARVKLNETAPVKVAFNDFIIKAVAGGLEKFPIMTGQLDGENIKLAEAIGIGLAITVPDGLVAPIVKDVDKKSLVQVAEYSKALIERAKNNKLSPTDIEGGCITVSNLGAFGIDSFIPIVVPGQCSILGIGQIADTCLPDNGEIAVRKLMKMTLSVDHKVANGAYAAQFLDYVRKLLEDPASLQSV